MYKIENVNDTLQKAPLKLHVRPNRAIQI